MQGPAGASAIHAGVPHCPPALVHVLRFGSGAQHFRTLFLRFQSPCALPNMVMRCPRLSTSQLRRRGAFAVVLDSLRDELARSRAFAQLWKTAHTQLVNGGLSRRHTARPCSRAGASAGAHSTCETRICGSGPWITGVASCRRLPPAATSEGRAAHVRTRPATSATSQPQPVGLERLSQMAAVRDPGHPRGTIGHARPRIAELRPSRGNRPPPRAIHCSLPRCRIVHCARRHVAAALTPCFSQKHAPRAQTVLAVKPALRSGSGDRCRLSHGHPDVTTATCGADCEQRADFPLQPSVR